MNKSLIAKIAAKEILTPYEAIHIQYLNNKHIYEQVPDVERWLNPYIAADNVPAKVSSIDIQTIIEFQNYEDAMLYDSYKWAITKLFGFDLNAGSLGYKCLAILNELRYMQSEKIREITRNIRDNKPIEGTLLEFSAYSYIHQEVMSYEQLVASFISTFTLLIMGINNILVLNYYLKTMVSLEELQSLKYLKMLLFDEEPEVEQQYKAPNLAKLCYEKTEEIINSNHSNFVELINRQLASFAIVSQTTFEEGSLEYVKKSLQNI